MNPVAQLRSINADGHIYQAIVVWCPGCEYPAKDDGHPVGGLYMLPVGGDVDGRPEWDFDGNLDRPTLSPSILTHTNRPDRPEPFVCHSFLRAGEWQFLEDSTHALAGQTVPMSPLPDWVVS